MIAQVLRATMCSEDEAAAWGARIRPFERCAPGYEGGVLLLEGSDVLVMSCWTDPVDAEAALDPVLAQLTGAQVGGMLTRPLSCRVRAL